MPDPSKVFVVHGRNEEARTALFRFLRSVGLQPIEWTEAISLTGEASPYLGHVLDQGFETAQAIVVLITGDDLARLRSDLLRPDDPTHERSLTPQARANVLFEAGLAFGRNPERTILVELGVNRPFSDVAGRHILRLSNRVEDRQALIARLQAAGCILTASSRTDWLREGDFDAVTRNSLPHERH
jgi:predicted nucleotide-binding protein